MSTIFLVLSLISHALARGPHHPRGASITKQHTHYRPTRGVNNEKLTKDMELLHDTEHIQEDLGPWAQEKDLSNMSDEELEFHYFQIHDFDKNKHLDGLEILQAIRHTLNHEKEHEHDEDLKEESEADRKKREEDEFQYYVELIDRVLNEDDTDGDGYLSYPEYVAGRKKETDQKVTGTIGNNDDIENV